MKHLVTQFCNVGGGWLWSV